MLLGAPDSTWAQAPASAAPDATLGTVTVSSGAEAPGASVSGFGDEPPERSPFSAHVLNNQALSDIGARRLADVIQLDASASDAYNAIGYWDYVTLRGFVLDPRGNYRRDGMPISAETSISLENKESIELLKGTSGIQAGTSAPGGLVNYVVKRPTQENLRKLRVQTDSNGSIMGHVDLGGRFGVDQALGYRLNVAAEHVASHVPGADGHRELAALAMDWRLKPGSLLEVELEHSRKSQPGVPGLSLTGNTLPAPDPFININSQPWSQPGVMQGLTGSVRLEQAINNDWSWSAHWVRQQLKADDFLAYPYGCYDAGSDVYYADRYCPNGNFDLYDYRSLNEHRRTEALTLQLKGQFNTASVRHQLTAGVQQSRYDERGQPQADNNAAVGTGNIYSLPTLPSDPSFSDPYTDLTERSTEWFVYDRMSLTRSISLWAGLRHSEIHRESVRTDGSRATAYSQGFSTPWLALAWLVSPGTLLYASSGQGVESFVAPGRSRYTNAGQPLDPLKSRQWELGVKHQEGTTTLGAALFGITQPKATDAGSCDLPDTCTFQNDGQERHRGLELSTSHQWGTLNLNLAATWLHAERLNSTVTPGLNGTRPTNVPNMILRAGLGYKVRSVPGLSFHGSLSHEGNRTVVPDGTIVLPAWTRMDTGVTYQTRSAGQVTTWKLGVSNLLNRRYFQESPYQYSHIYLFPAAPRTVQLAMETSF
jgi:iron complex outermembrane receptor protein